MKAREYLDRVLEPERVDPEWTMTWKAKGQWEELTCGHGIFRCKACGRRWDEEHARGDQGTNTLTLRRLPDTSPDDYLSADIVRERAAKLAAAHLAARAAFDRFSVTRDPRDEQRWTDAVKNQWKAKSALYSPDLEVIVERLRLGDRTAVEPAVVFLEADPWCFRSGYLKENLMRYLSRMPLTEDTKARLRRVVIAVLMKGRRRELPMTRRLARAVADRELASALARMHRDPKLREAHERVGYIIDGLVV